MNWMKLLKTQVEKAQSTEISIDCWNVATYKDKQHTYRYEMEECHDGV